MVVQAAIHQLLAAGVHYSHAEHTVCNQLSGSSERRAALVDRPQPQYLAVVDGAQLSQPPQLSKNNARVHSESQYLTVVGDGVGDVIEETNLDNVMSTSSYSGGNDEDDFDF